MDSTRIGLDEGVLPKLARSIRLLNCNERWQFISGTEIISLRRACATSSRKLRYIRWGNGISGSWKWSSHSRMHSHCICKRHSAFDRAPLGYNYRLRQNNCDERGENSRVRHSSIAAAQRGRFRWIGCSHWRSYGRKAKSRRVPCRKAKSSWWKGTSGDSVKLYSY